MIVINNIIVRYLFWLPPDAFFSAFSVLISPFVRSLRPSIYILIYPPLGAMNDVLVALSSCMDQPELISDTLLDTATRGFADAAAIDPLTNLASHVRQ